MKEPHTKIMDSFNKPSVIQQNGISTSTINVQNLFFTSSKCYITNHSTRNPLSNANEEWMNSSINMDVQNVAASFIERNSQQTTQMKTTDQM